MPGKKPEERNMDEPRNVPFGELDWTDDASGIRAGEAEVGGKRWATVEYGEGAHREDWCEEGHRGYVVSGEIEYEFDDDREPLRASQGEAFLLPTAVLGSGAHRGRNTAPMPTRLFLIDG
jgi:hypothetical protein